jgi:hypothetical protein
MTRSILPILFAAVLAVLAGCAADDASEDASSTEAAALADTFTPPSASEIIRLQEEVHIDGKAGRWSKVRPTAGDAVLTEEQQHQIKRLESLGYVGGSQLAPTMENVTVHDPERAWQGLNFFTSGHAPTAVLMDMDGQVIHRWGLGYWTVWPDADTPRYHDGTMHWRRARILPGGDLLAIFEGLGIIKIDRHSNLIWANHCRAHHDLEVLPDGDIIVLAREARMLPRVHPRQPVLEDFIVRLSSGGEIKERVSLLEAFENSTEYRSILDRRTERAGDIFHTNSLEMLDGRIADRAPAFAAGRVLISLCELNAVAVVDLERVEVVWALQGPFRRQHDATILDDGNLMLFNNIHQPGMSAIEVFDPADGSLLWRYRGSAERLFFTRTCGTNQKLANGNILITESDNGRSFEIAPDETVVWEFYNPNRTGESNEYIATLFELLRLPSDFPVNWAITPR